MVVAGGMGEDAVADAGAGIAVGENEDRVVGGRSGEDEVLEAGVVTPIARDRFVRRSAQ